jgi:hypothetical protein
MKCNEQRSEKSFFSTGAGTKTIISVRCFLSTRIPRFNEMYSIHRPEAQEDSVIFDQNNNGLNESFNTIYQHCIIDTISIEDGARIQLQKKKYYLQYFYISEIILFIFNRVMTRK